MLGISKADFEGTARKHRRNYDFFGAPVGIISTPKEDLEIGSWLDVGISIGSLSIAARGRGLDTCAQAAFADFHALNRSLHGLPERTMVICGLALGYADPHALENQLVTERASLSQFATFAGFLGRALPQARMNMQEINEICPTKCDCSNKERLL